MKTIDDTGSRNSFFSVLPTAVLASISTVVIMQWLPVLSFFFAVPLCILFFCTAKKTFVFTIFITFGLDVVAAVTTMLINGMTVTPEAVLTALAGSAFFILPLLFLVLPGNLKFRYRLACAGTIAAACWLGLFLLTDAGDMLVQTLRLLTDELSTVMYSMIPEGFERTTFQAQLTPDLMYSMTLDVLLFSVLPMCILLYVASFKMGKTFSGKRDALPQSAVKAVDFYNDYILFIPLVLGMTGITIGRIFSERYLTIVSWNVALASGIFFVYQGMGVFTFFLKIVQRKTRWPFFVFFLIMSILFLFNGWLFFLASLLIVGVVELFIPLRLRFDNIDTVDPTPGNDGDQT